MTRASMRVLGPLWTRTWADALGETAEESVAFLTANFFWASDRLVFLCEKLVPAHGKDYLRRGELHLQVSPLYVSRVLNVAESTGSSVVMVHSHPFETAVPVYSATDNHGEALTSETISKCLVGNPPVASLLFGRSHAAARAWHGLEKRHYECDVTVLNGHSLQRFASTQRTGESRRPNILGRQVDAVGLSTQRAIESLRVGIVGLGGTGSSVAEQLTRMGVRSLVLVDPDLFESTNWSRVYGSTARDLATSRHKVDLVADHLLRISPELAIERIPESVMRRAVLERLAGCDLVFSCLDRHAPRAVVNELAYQCFVPVVDVGIGIDNIRAARLIGGAIRATVVGPGLPCLLCRDIVRPEMITAEHLSPEEYAARRAVGYVPIVPQDAPSVIAYTTMAASMGIAVFLEFMLDSESSVQSLVFDLMSKETFRLSSSIKKECVCQKRLGQGFRMPFSVAD